MNIRIEDLMKSTLGYRISYFYFIPKGEFVISVPYTESEHYYLLNNCNYVSKNDEK